MLLAVVIGEARQSMKKAGIGGANTRTGLAFEGKTSLVEFLAKQPGFSVVTDKLKIHELHYNGELTAYLFRQSAFYKFLASKGVDWKEILSKRLMPDDALYVPSSNTLFVIECKYQQVGGSVDEKLQTCDYKRKQYLKLMKRLGGNVEYIYLLSDWFRNPCYRDVLAYINEVGCHYYFNEVELERFGI